MAKRAAFVEEAFFRLAREPGNETDASFRDVPDSRFQLFRA
jgi:hypothetical protein